MHLLFILGIIMKGGAEISMLTLARGLSERGYRVTLVTYGQHRDFVQHAGKNVAVIQLPQNRTFEVFFPLYRLLRKLRPHVLVTALTHTNVASILAAAAAHTGTRVVVTEHGQTALDPHYLKKIEGLLLPIIAGALYATADEVVAVSKGLAKFIEGIIPWKRTTPVRVIYNPAVPISIPPAPAAPHPWLGAGEPIIISVGRMQKEKNFSHLIHAFAEVAKKRPARLVILGEGAQEAELKALTQQLGIQDRVLFPGFVKNVSDWLQHSQIFVCTSLLEAFGNAIVEAMACGLTVVSVDCPHGPAEILEQGRYGFLVPQQNVAALATAISNAIDSPMDKDYVRTRAAMFNEKQCFDGYDQLLQRLYP
jgi:glycosyltransferase involved in cell wall biosynthesis